VLKQARVLKQKRTRKVRVRG